MPEIPDLEAVRAVLEPALRGRRIERVETPRATVIRVPAAEFRARVTGRAVESITRRGKFLLFHLNSADVLVVNPMLRGRFQRAPVGAKRPARTCVVLTLGPAAAPHAEELLYIDERLMGKWYLASREALDSIPQFGELGPDALDAKLTQAVLLQRLRRYRGQVKTTLINQQFIAGIGNAYADEILFRAGIHPLHTVRDLDEDGRRRLYRAMGDVLAWAIPIVLEAMGEATETKPRDFLRVHRKGGQPCPQCGTRISEMRPHRRVTSYCRHCQPEAGR